MSVCLRLPAPGSLSNFSVTCLLLQKGKTMRAANMCLPSLLCQHCTPRLLSQSAEEERGAEAGGSPNVINRKG